jgi:apolipoprotein N-acyltransferase
VLSNDAGFRASPIAHHMTNRAIVQAVENGRWLVRVGQAGISAVVDPAGRVRGALGLFEHGVLMAEVGRRRDQPFASRYGDWALWPALLVIVLAVARASSRRPRA